MQITIILGIFLALLVGEILSGTGEEGPAKWLSNFTGPQSAVLITGLTLLTWSLMRVVSRQVVAKLKRTEWPQPAVLRLPGRVDLLLRAPVLGAFAVQVPVGGWAHLICGRWRLQRFILLDEILVVQL